MPLLVRSFLQSLLALAAGGALVGSLARAETDASPFLPVAGASATANAAAPDATFELAGASVTSHGTQLCIFDVQAKRSRWITVGETVDQIKVVSYDVAKDEAIISVNGTQKSLALRKILVTSSGVPSAPIAAAPAPVYGNQPLFPSRLRPPVDNRPPEVAKQEREARMLVSDLLEIGIQQRKAYEEAQKASLRK